MSVFRFDVFSVRFRFVRRSHLVNSLTQRLSIYETINADAAILRCFNRVWLLKLIEIKLKEQIHSAHSHDIFIFSRI